MTLTSRLIRLFHTIRYLRPVQIYYRLWFRLYRPVFIRHASLELREAADGWLSGAPKAQTQIEPQKFSFLNKSRELTCSADWNNPNWETLWLYNLHYFDDLCAHDANERLDWHTTLLAKWIQENPPGAGVGWHSYPLSLRIVNWIKWAFADNRLNRSSLDSLAIQARYLNKRIEHHLLGNHLFANAKALVFAGAFFSGGEAKTWFEKGLKIIHEQLPEQVLRDGGHFERSPMYHGIFLEDVLDLINLARRYPALFDNRDIETSRSFAQTMLEWLVTMCHPDRNIAFFNDTALGIAASPDQLKQYADRVGLKPIRTPRRSITNLRDSGFVRIAKGPVVGFLDVGEIGPSYNAGHAHADTLSFELSLFSDRFLVNSGTSCYEPGPERTRQRGTSAHNTITIDGHDSSEVWASFRVARRAMPLGLAVNESAEEVTVQCAHDGYMRRSNRSLHTRKWTFKENGIRIKDEISGTPDQAVGYYHFYPGVTLEIEESGIRGHAITPSDKFVRWQIVGGFARILESTYHPYFGHSVRSNCLAITFDKLSCETEFDWN